ENNRKLAGRSVDSIQLHDRLPGGFRREVLRSLLIQEEFETDAATATGVTALGRRVSFTGQRPDVQTSHRLAIEVEDAVASCDHHLAQVVGIRGLNLKDPWVIGSGALVGPFDQIDPFGERRFSRSGDYRIQVAPRAFLQRYFLDLRRPGGDTSGDP